MSLSYLDKTGLAALWAKIKAKFVSRSVISTTASDVTSTTSNRYIGSNIVVRDGNVDVYESDNGVSSETWVGLYAQDMHGKNIGKAAPGVNPDGRVKMELYAQNYNSSGESVGSNVLTMTVNKSGNSTVYVSAPEAWRDAIGAGTGDGTVTSVTIVGGTGINCSSSTAITTTGTRTLSLDPSEARSTIGTKYGILSKSVTSATSVASSTSVFTAIDNISTADGLTTGYWIVQATVNFSANASGYRVAVLSQNTSITGANNWGTVIVGASPSDATRIQVTALMNITSTKTPIHLFVKQNSGSRLNVVTMMRAFRLSL